MLSNDACFGRSLLTSEVPKDRVMVIWHMVECQRTWAGMGIVRTEKGGVQLVMFDDQTMRLWSVSGGDRDGVGSVIRNITAFTFLSMCSDSVHNLFRVTMTFYIFMTYLHYAPNLS